MKKTVLAAAVSIWMVGGACGQQAYVSAALGTSHVNLDCNGTTQCDQNDSGFKLLGGLKMSTNLSLEASYIDFGKARYEYVQGSTTIGGRLDASALTVGGALRYDFIPEFTGVLRLGMAYVTSKVDEPNAAATSHATKPYWGLGAEYAFDKNWKGVASADFTTGKFRGTNGVVRLYSVGAQYGF